MISSSKKASVEIQFNWIFILIAGGLILIFFFSIVMKQSEVSKSKIAASISVDMGSIFKGAQVGTDTEHLVDMPPVNLEFVCEDGYSGYRVENAEESIPYLTNLY